jgi:hypothetical protein
MIAPASMLLVGAAWDDMLIWLTKTDLRLYHTFRDSSCVCHSTPDDPSALPILRLKETFRGGTSIDRQTIE